MASIVLDEESCIELLAAVLRQAMFDATDSRLEDLVVTEAKEFLLDLGAGFLIGKTPIHHSAGYSTDIQETHHVSISSHSITAITHRSSHL